MKYRDSIKLGKLKYTKITVTEMVRWDDLKYWVTTLYVEDKQGYPHKLEFVFGDSDEAHKFARKHLKYLP